MAKVQVNILIDEQYLRLLKQLVRSEAVIRDCPVSLTGLVIEALKEKYPEPESITKRTPGQPD